MEGYWCFRKWVQWSPCIGGAKCGLIASNGRDVQSLTASATAPRAFAAVPSLSGVFACVHVYILYLCVYKCVCVYVCGHVYMYIDACVYVFVHLCVYTHVYVYVYAYLCIDCGSQYQCFSVWTVSCMRVCVHVHMYVHAYVCRYIYMCIFLQ